MTELPSGWTEATLEDVASWSSGGTPSRNRDDYFGGDIPWVKTGELTCKYIHSTEESLTALGLKNSSAKIFPRGSVGIAMYGATIGKVSIWGIEASTNQACAVAQPVDGVVSSEFLYHYLSSQKDALVKKGKGGAQPNISQGLLKTWPIAVPPYKEQYRIVEKIEASFDEIEKGVESLQTAKATLGLYRQSLLKAAFEGRLTADWREQNAEKLEDPETLLARVRVEREDCFNSAMTEWEKAIAQWHAAGRTGKKPTRPKPLKTKTNQPLFEVISVSDLPQTWVAVKLVQVIDVVSGGTPKGIQGCTGRGIPFYKVSDMNTPGNERVMKAAQLSVSVDEAASLGLSICPASTVIFPKRGGAILTNKKRQLGQESAFDLNTMGLVNRTETVTDEYLWFWMLGVRLPDIYDGSNVPQINNKNIEPLSFPVCSLAEQAEITRILSERLEVGDALEKEIDASLVRADALRQSVLKKAFSGKLVPQDPSDELATTLLDRIKSAPRQKSDNAMRKASA